MARFYTNENFALQVVTELRRLGHDVITSLEAGKANSAAPDIEVLAFAVTEGRILLTTIVAISFAFINVGVQTIEGLSCVHSIPIFAGRRSAFMLPLQPTPK